MNACLGCFALLVLMIFFVMAMQAVAAVWTNHWPIIVGLGASWAAMRYIKAQYPED